MNKTLWTTMDKIGQNRTLWSMDDIDKIDIMDKIGQQWSNWTKWSNSTI